MLPAITFIFSRKACDDARDACLDAGLRLTTPDERARVRAIVDERTAALADADLDVLGFDRFLAGLEMGVAAHHAGMVPPFKEAVEACFTEGLTKAVFATETLALGVNMPARSVVIERLTKFSGERRELLTPGEYTQLTGRAGRRGIDDVGYAIVLWSPFVPFEQVAALASSRTYALRSAFRPTYNMAANLVRRYEPDEAHHLLNLSFAQFQADKAVVRLEARIERQHGRLARLREEARLRARRRRGVPPAPQRRPAVPGRRSVHRRSRCGRPHVRGAEPADPGRRARPRWHEGGRAQRGLPQGEPAPPRGRRAQQASLDRRRRALRAAARGRHRRAPRAVQPEQPRLPAPGGRGAPTGPDQPPRRARRRGPRGRRRPSSRPRRTRWPTAPTAKRTSAAPSRPSASRASWTTCTARCRVAPARWPAGSTASCASSRRGATSTAGRSRTRARCSPAPTTSPISSSRRR